jgi:hypothetical protein
LGITCVYFEKPTPTHSNIERETDHGLTPFPLFATGALPATVDAGGLNEIGIEERTVVTVAVATMTDALHRGLASGPDHGTGLLGGTFRISWGPQLTLTLVDCAYTADVTVSGLVTWAHSEIFLGRVALVPLTARSPPTSSSVVRVPPAGRCI